MLFDCLNDFIFIDTPSLFFRIFILEPEESMNYFHPNFQQLLTKEGGFRG